MEAKNEQNHVKTSYYDHTYSFYAEKAGNFGKLTRKTPGVVGEFVSDIFGGSMLALVPGFIAYVIPGIPLMIPSFAFEVVCAVGLGVSAPFTLIGAKSVDVLTSSLI